MAKGVLPYQELEKLIDKGCIKASKAQLQPASLDLSLSEELYRVEGVFLPRVTDKVEDLIKAALLYRHDLSKPLEIGATYIARLQEELKLPVEIFGYANPKSSTGRIDLQARLLADYTPRFDAVPAGYEGALWAALTSRSFLVKLNPGDSLLQLRLLNAESYLNHQELEQAYSEHKMLYTPKGRFISYDEIKINDFDGSLILTIDLESEAIVGYEACNKNKVLDFAGSAKLEDFFTPILKPKDSKLLLNKGNFYIFFTKEWIRLPPSLTAEIIPIDPRSGEFRSHYAGFIDPGFGYKGKGRPLVLELRAFDSNIILRDNQPICKLRFEHMAAEPVYVYGQLGSHYQNQRGAKLSKHFKV